MDAITESKDIKTLRMDVLIGILRTHELKKKQDSAKREGKKDKTLVLQAAQSDEKIDGVGMAYLTKSFKKFVRKSHKLEKKGNAGKAYRGTNLCHGCGKPSYFIKECPHDRGDHEEGKERRRD